MSNPIANAPHQRPWFGQYVCNFLQKYWDVVGNDVTCMVLNVLNSVDIVFCLPSICVPNPKNSKNVKFSPGDHGNIQINMVYPFRHRSTQSTILGQNDQNAPPKIFNFSLFSTIKRQCSCTLFPLLSFRTLDLRF